MADEASGAKDGLEKALSAKIKGVPVVAVGAVVVIGGAVAVRVFGKKGTSAASDTSTSGDPGSDAQPTFLAKSPPSNWLALDSASGLAFATDGTPYGPIGTGTAASSPVSVPAPAKPTPTAPATATPKPVVKSAVTPKPASKFHTVKSGETLSGIAKSFNTTVPALVKLNGIKNPNLIYAGTSIRVH